MDTVALSTAERMIHRLNSLYGSYGYLRYKMNKFEEYDLYAKNKDFLISDNIITFTDTNGRLLALKPDVTISIVKNAGDVKKGIRKLYYNENVYRISKGTGAFKELMQVGLEAVGNIDDYCIFEVLELSAKSLLSTQRNVILEITHLDILSEVFDYIGIPESGRKELMNLIGGRNLHELSPFLDQIGVSKEYKDTLISLVSLYGGVDEVLPKIRELIGDMVSKETLDSFNTTISLLSGDKAIKDILRIDFHATGHSRYYNGYVFKGFIEDVPEPFLSGGQYDHLVKRMKQDSKAIGFAVYLDALLNNERATSDYDVDCCVVYERSSSLPELEKAVAQLRATEGRVCVRQSIPSDIRYRQLYKFENGVLSKVSKPFGEEEK